jgi:hypothetical protein
MRFWSKSRSSNANDMDVWLRKQRTFVTLSRCGNAIRKFSCDELKMKHGANNQNIYQQHEYRLTGKTPNKITEEIFKLCKELDNTEEPIFVKVNLEQDAKRAECTKNVHNKIRRDGGRIQFGWAIWELSNIMIEAIYHALWISPQGEPIDITPQKHISPDHILFLADSKDKYNYGSGFQRRDNVRKPLSDSPEVAEFIEICEEIFEFEEKVSPGPVINFDGEDLECYEALERRKNRLSRQIRASFKS